MSSTLDAVHREPEDDAGLRHPVVGVGAERAAVERRGPDREAVLGLGHVAAHRVELGGQRGEPVGLVPADVRDPAQVRGGVGHQAERSDGGGQLADVVQVVVEPVQGARAGHGQALVGELGAAAHQRDDLAQRVPGLGGGPRPVQDGHLPPVTRPAARNGAAFDRSGSTCTSTARIADGQDPPAVDVGVVDVDAAQPQLLDGHVDVRERRDRLALVADVDALVVPGAGEQQRGDELARGGGVDGDPATADAAGADDGERQRAAVLVLDHDAEPAQALQDLVHRAEPGVRVAVEDHRAVGQRGDRRHEAHHRAGQAAVDRLASAQPPGRDLPVRTGGVDADAELGEGGGHQPGVARAQRLPDDAGAVRQRGEHEGPVGDRLRAGQPDGGAHRSGGVRGRPECAVLVHRVRA